ncbi:hypothetical protein [Roseobacter sp.]|uniref:hypothetical protein n=1 Tax=Roseobacter sp. TaxID=1907202 RepID=UPI00329979C5
MSVIEEIKQLEAQKQKLLSQAKSEAMASATKAVADLKTLGFEYHLAEGPKPKAKAAAAPKKGPKTRRGGMRDLVLKAVAASDAGMVRKEIFTALNVTEKSEKQATANALAALKKSGELIAEGRVYKAT